MKRFHLSTAIAAGLILLVLFVPLVEPVQLPLVVLVLFLYGIVLIYGASQIDSQFFMPAFCQGDKSGGKIAITFDDGPCGEHSEKILELLQKFDCRASFSSSGTVPRCTPK